MKKTYYISKNAESAKYCLPNVVSYGHLLISYNNSAIYYENWNFVIEDSLENNEWLMLETLKGNILYKIEVDSDMLKGKFVYDFVNKNYSTYA